MSIQVIHALGWVVLVMVFVIVVCIEKIHNHESWLEAIKSIVACILFGFIVVLAIVITIGLPVLAVYLITYH